MRGNNDHTMKSLKKELVDALKDALLRCSKEANRNQQNGQNGQNGQNENGGNGCLEENDDDRLAGQSQKYDVEDDDVEVTNMSDTNDMNTAEEISPILSSKDSSHPTNPSNPLNPTNSSNPLTITIPKENESIKKTRNGSLMAEFRSLINTPSSQTKIVESEEDRAHKIQTEHNARQQRHRQSQTGRIPTATADDNNIMSEKVVNEMKITDNEVKITKEMKETKEQREIQSNNISIINSTASAAAVSVSSTLSSPPVVVSPPDKGIQHNAHSHEISAQTSTAHSAITHLQSVEVTQGAEEAEKTETDAPYVRTAVCPASPVASSAMDLQSPAPVMKSETVSLSSHAGVLALTQLPDESTTRSDRERESMSSTPTYSTVHSSLSMAFNTNGGLSNLTAQQISNMQIHAPVQQVRTLL